MIMQMALSALREVDALNGYLVPNAEQSLNF